MFKFDIYFKIFLALFSIHRYFVQMAIMPLYDNATSVINQMSVVSVFQALLVFVK